MLIALLIIARTVQIGASILRALFPRQRGRRFCLKRNSVASGSFALA